MPQTIKPSRINDCVIKGGVTRREFIKAVGLASAGALAASSVSLSPTPTEAATITLKQPESAGAAKQQAYFQRLSAKFKNKITQADREKAAIILRPRAARRPKRW